MVIANQIILSANTGEEKTLRTLLNELTASAQALKGCHKFEFYQFENTREQFMIVEIWKSGQAHKKYLQDETVKTLWKQTQPLIFKQDITPLKLTQCLTKQQYWNE